MPSIINHENVCWGVKRSFCNNMFQYDLNEELQTSKLIEFGSASNVNNSTVSNNSVNYSVSSNGYYGFQPHSVIPNKGIENNAMDVEESANSTANIGLDTGALMDCTRLSSEFQLDVKRKRRIGVLEQINMPHYKRMKHEEDAEIEARPPSQDIHYNEGGSCVRRRRRLSEKVDLNEVRNETTIQLLRQTHGCEVYLYERSCDY